MGLRSGQSPRDRLHEAKPGREQGVFSRAGQAIGNRRPMEKCCRWNVGQARGMGHAGHSLYASGVVLQNQKK